MESVEDIEIKLLLSLKNLDKEKAIECLSTGCNRVLIKWMEEYKKEKCDVTLIGIDKCFKSIVFDKFIKAEKNFFQDEEELKSYVSSKFFKETLRIFVGKEFTEENLRKEELKLEEEEMYFKAHFINEVLINYRSIIRNKYEVKVGDEIYRPGTISISDLDKCPEYNCKINGVVITRKENTNSGKRINVHLGSASDLRYVKEDIIKKINNIQNSIKSVNVKDKNVDISIEDISKKLIEEFKKEKVDFSNTKHIQSKDIREYFIYAFKKAKEEIDIVCPWIGEWVLDDEFISLVENTLKRKTKIKILYGIKDNSRSNRREDTSDKVAMGLVRKFARYGELFKVKKTNTHYKLLICDEDFCIAGSFNFLSFKGEYENEDTRHEGAEYSRNPESIRIKRSIYFDF